MAAYTMQHSRHDAISGGRSASGTIVANSSCVQDSLSVCRYTSCYRTDTARNKGLSYSA
jgi:hypothetical protein